MKNITEDYIVLNKPFVGGYISKDGNDAHEIINFFKADNGMHFIYNNPYGQFFAKQNGTTPNVKYVVFTSKTKNKKFTIKYVAKIGCTLHTATISKKNINNAKKADDYVKQGTREIADTLKEKYQIDKLDDITYDGVPISKLFSDGLKALPFTFVCSGFYKPNKEILINGEDGTFDYNFQRNFGYISENKSYNAYKEINEHLKNLDTEFVEYPITKFKALDYAKNKEDLKSMEPNTFLDLISLHKEEESYTKMLGNLVSCDKRLINSLVDTILKNKKPEEYKKDSKINNINDVKGDFVFRNKYLFAEYGLSKDGRVDLYSEAENCRLIIENKIESDITINQTNEDQLNRYYNHFNNGQKDNSISNIFVILAPEYRHEEIYAELKKYNMDKHWFLIGYSDIYNFVKDNKDIIQDTKYGRYYDDLLLLFKRHSFDETKLAQVKLTRNKLNMNKQ